MATASAMLIGVEGGSLVARDRAVQKAVAALPASQRSFRVDAFQLAPGQDYRAADRTMRTALASLTPRAPLRGMFFRELRLHGQLVQLSSLEHLGALVRLRSGRLPRTCDPERCEVLQLGPGDGSTAWDEGAIHVVRVGVGSIRDRALFGSSLQPARELNGERPVLLVAAGADAFDPLPAFAGIYRSYTWIAPIDPRQLHVWQISGVLARESRAQTSLARYSDVYELSGPDQALLAARSQGKVSAQRMVLIGGEVSALLLGFALVAAIGLRRGLANERRRLLQRGARRPQLWLAQSTEVAAMTLAGGILGVVGGLIALVVLARSTHLSIGQLLDHSIASATGIAIVVGAWLAATVAVLAVAGWTEREPERRRLRLLDVAALGAAVAVALGFARGGLSSDSLSSGGDSGLLLLLPGLIAFVVAVLAGRLLGPLMRGWERLARRGPAALRLALLALARAPTRTVATAAFLLVSLGFALFAVSYRATLGRGAHDEAAFAVPLDFTLSEGSQLVQPLDAARLARYERLAPGVRAYPVLRETADVVGAGTSVSTPTVLGLSPDAVRRLHWRSDFSSSSPGELARRLGEEGPAFLRGARLPRGTTAVALPVRVRGVSVHVDIALEGADRQIALVSLGDRGPGRARLVARLPRAGALDRIVGLEVSLSTAEELGATHNAAEGTESTIASGALELGRLQARTASGWRLATTWRGWVARGGARVRPGAAPVLSYAFDQGQTMLLRRPQQTDGRPLLVVASPGVARFAGPGGSITLDFQDERVPARIVAVARRFPAAEQADEGFVIADESRLATALDSRLPGTGTPGEVWLSVPHPAVGAVERELRRPPYSALALASRRDLERSLSGNPLARGITTTLAVAGLVALLLAVLGFWLALVSELRDERGELFDLEAQGVSPDTLRRQFRLRALILIGLGALGGVLLGVVLSLLVVALVRVSAVAGQAQPPLRFEPGWAVAAGGLGALVVTLAVVLELTTRHAFRGDRPARASWSLE